MFQLLGEISFISHHTAKLNNLPDIPKFKEDYLQKIIVYSLHQEFEKSGNAAINDPNANNKKSCPHGEGRTSAVARKGQLYSKVYLDCITFRPLTILIPFFISGRRRPEGEKMTRPDSGVIVVSLMPVGSISIICPN